MKYSNSSCKYCDNFYYDEYVGEYKCSSEKCDFKISKPVENPKNLKLETVNHPKHYNREGAMECIDEMILLYGIDAVMNFCLCNAHKYRYRASYKNGEEDLKKSDFYINKYKELKEQNGQ